MKVKTSVTLSQDLLKAIDKRSSSAPYKNRSDFLEKAVRTFLKDLERKERDARELEIINRNAERLNQEAMDALKYQVPL